MLNILVSIGIGILGFIVSLLICAAIGREKVTEILDMGDSYAVSNVKKSNAFLMWLVAGPVTAFSFGFMLKNTSDSSIAKILGLSALALVGIIVVSVLISAIIWYFTASAKEVNSFGKGNEEADDRIGFKITGMAAFISCAASGVMLAIAIANMGLF